MSPTDDRLAHIEITLKSLLGIGRWLVGWCSRKDLNFRPEDYESD